MSPLATRLLGWFGLLALLGAGGCGGIFSAPDPGSKNDTPWAVTGADAARTIPLNDGTFAPLIAIRFDRNGDVVTPDSLASLQTALREPGVTHVYVFTPGWESGWHTAIGWIETFAANYERLRAAALIPAAGPLPATQPAYRAVYIAALWPADAEVEKFPGPSPAAKPRAVLAETDRDAAGEVLGTDVGTRTIARIRTELTDRGHVGRANRLEQLLARTRGGTQMAPPDQIELADCLLPLYGAQEEPAVPGARYAAAAGRPSVKRIPKPIRTGLLAVDPPPLPPVDALELLDLWKRMSRELSAAAANPPVSPEAMKSRPLSVPEFSRWALRATDYRISKDWAFRVGRGGISNLLQDVRVKAPAASLHVVGHSHGCEALLAAISRTDKQVSVDSLLMLQPLVSAWALANAPAVGADVAPGLQKVARGGAYRLAAEGRVTQSIIATYGDGDWIANAFASRAVRRPTLDGFASPDLLAAGGGVGGFTPLAAGGFAGNDLPVRRTPIISVTAPFTARPERYPLERPASGPAITAIDTTGVLRAHGEVNQASFWWMLVDQVVQ